MALFNHITIIGAGLIGSSLARAIKQLAIARTVAIGDTNSDHCEAALRLGFADTATVDLAESVEGADMVVLATPLLSFSIIMQAIAPHLARDCIITDVGSVKTQAIADITPYVPDGCFYVPGHPIAGTEFSGPDAGFAEMFRDAWLVLTPTADTSLTAMAQVQSLWDAVGAKVVTMTPEHHDRIFALTSHLPSLLSFGLVDTVAELGGTLQSEVLQYAFGGFKGASRLAAQDPIVWRDIFITNKDALLDHLQLLQDNLANMAKAIRWNDAAYLEERFTRAQIIRRSLK